MLRAIGAPLSFVILLLAFVVCLTLSGWITAALAARQGQRGLRQEGRTRPDPRRQIEAFGAVGVVLGGLGWSRPVDAPRRSGLQVAVVVLTGPVVLVVLGLALLAGFGVYYDQGLNLLRGSSLLRDGLADVGGVPVGQQVWLLSGLTSLYVGLLAFVPIPPLPGGQVLFAAAPRTLGWQKAEHQLVGRNIGTAIVLALLLIPLGGPDALLPNVLDTLVRPLVRLVTGG